MAEGLPFHVFCHVTAVYQCKHSHTYLIIARRCRIGGRLPSISAIAATEHYPEGKHTLSAPLEAVVCWRRATSSLSFCLRATTEILPIPSPRAIAESTPSKSNQSASSRPINSSASSAVFNQIPTPFLHQSDLPASPAAARYTNKLPDLPSIPSLWLP